MSIHAIRAVQPQSFMATPTQVNSVGCTSIHSWLGGPWVPLLGLLLVSCPWVPLLGGLGCCLIVCSSVSFLLCTSLLSLLRSLLCGVAPGFGSLSLSLSSPCSLLFLCLGAAAPWALLAILEIGFVCNGEGHLPRYSLWVSNAFTDP